LDLLLDQDRRLEKLVAEWDRLARGGTHSEEEAVKRAWRRGTVGKLIHQHAAIRLAAGSDVVRCLRLAGELRMADVMDRHADEARGAIDRLDEHSRGMSALDLRYSDDFDRAVDDLRHLWRSEFRSDSEFSLERVRSALGPERSHLRSARHVAKHAPLHPARRRRWYHRIAPIERMHSVFDLLRGFPTAESTVFSDAGLAQQFDADD
jgi:hypothetical protein